MLSVYNIALLSLSSAFAAPQAIQMSSAMNGYDAWLSGLDTVNPETAMIHKRSHISSRLDCPGWMPTTALVWSLAFLNPFNIRTVVSCPR